MLQIMSVSIKSYPKINWRSHQLSMCLETTITASQDNSITKATLSNFTVNTQLSLFLLQKQTRYKKKKQMFCTLIIEITQTYLVSYISIIIFLLKSVILVSNLSFIIQQQTPRKSQHLWMGKTLPKFRKKTLQQSCQRHPERQHIL